MRVDAFIAQELAKAFAWSETDCVSTADRWAKVATGVSFVEASGIVWHSQAEAEAILAETPLHIAFNRAMKAAGFPRTANPQPGDLGLAISKDKLCVAIYTGKLWFSRDADGFIGVPEKDLWKAWSIHKGIA